MKLRAAKTRKISAGEAQDGLPAILQDVFQHRDCVLITEGQQQLAAVVPMGIYELAQYVLDTWEKEALARQDGEEVPIEQVINRLREQQAQEVGVPRSNMVKKLMYLPQDQVDAIKAEAEQNDRSWSAEVRILLSEALAARSQGKARTAMAR